MRQAACRVPQAGTREGTHCRARRGTGTDQGVRHHALLATLLGSGLRVSEMLHLERDPSTGQGLTCVPTTGGVSRDCVPRPREARQGLDAGLTARQDAAPALLLTRTGRTHARREASGIIRRVAAQAQAHLPEAKTSAVSPHVLRPMF
jgi:site-specific recombinase XerD